MEYRAEMGAHDEEFRGLGLTSRKNLCLHPEISKEKKGKLVDSKCRDMTSAFACEKGRAEPGSVPLCSFHEVSRLWIYWLMIGIKQLRDGQSDTSWCAHFGRCEAVRNGKGRLPILYHSTHGELLLTNTI